jgi:hypothetical protein
VYAGCPTVFPLRKSVSFLFPTGLKRLGIPSYPVIEPPSEVIGRIGSHIRRLSYLCQGGEFGIQAPRTDLIHNRAAQRSYSTLSCCFPFTPTLVLCPRCVPLARTLCSAKYFDPAHMGRSSQGQEWESWKVCFVHCVGWRCATSCRNSR